MSSAKKISDYRLEALREAAKLILPQGYWQNDSSAPNPSCHLTFDDGPHLDTTPYLIELLEELDISATFFFTGENSKKYPGLVEKTKLAGHQIGNHSYGHQFTLSLSIEEFQKDIDITNKIIEEASGEKPRVYRPPYGLIDSLRAKNVSEAGMQLVYWGALAEDWNPIGADEVTRRIMSQLKAGTIIVLHETVDTVSQNLEATKSIVQASKERKISFETINHLKNE